MRKPIIAGNWKMNNTIKESLDLVEGIKKGNLPENVEALVCVPFTGISEVKKAIEGTSIKLGAQNVHWEKNGAYTGEISIEMLKELNVEYIIVGHSERRQYFLETDHIVNKKIKAILAGNLKPILCVGESLEERESGIHKEVVRKQLVNGLRDVEKEAIENILVAYEPIWAIGSGKTASAEDASDMISYIREILCEIYDEESSQKVRLQYGGSVKPENISELMEKINIDGALVGGASLKAEDFLGLLNY